MSQVMQTSLRGKCITADLLWINGCFQRGKALVIGSDGHIEDLREVSECPSTINFPNSALMPGFVNAHSHAFHRGLRTRSEPAAPDGPSNFWSWRDGMYALAQDLAAEPATFAQVYKSAFAEMLRCGITTVGEFHYLHHSSSSEGNFDLDALVVKAAEEVGIRLCLLQAYYEQAGMNGEPLHPAQRHFVSSLDTYWEQFDKLSKTASSTVHLGVVGHSVRAVGAESLGLLHAEARRRGVVFHAHLEEQPAEIAASQAKYGCGPLQLLMRVAEVGAETTAVHLTHSTAADMDAFLAKGGNACFCPLTEGRLGDGIPVWPSGREAQISLGSDCNSRICFAEEMRWLLYTQQMKRTERGLTGQHPATAAKKLLEMGTLGGARSLGLSSVVGELGVGKAADFMLLDLSSPRLEGWTEASLLDAFIFGAASEDVVAAAAVAGQLHVFNAASQPEEMTSVPEQAKTMKISELDPASPNFVLEMTMAMMNINSTSGQEGPLASELSSWFSGRGLHVHSQPLPSDASRRNLLVSPTAFGGSGGPAVVLCSHLDTVPPFIPPTLHGNNLRGRGSNDAKGQVAKFVCALLQCPQFNCHKWDIVSLFRFLWVAAMTGAAFRLWAASVDVGLLLLVGEETDHCGAKAANALKLAPKLVICGEPTESHLASGQKGILKLTLCAKGKSGHSGYPERGVSAIDALLDVLGKLKATSWPSHAQLGPTTLNIGTIHGGEAGNVIAPSAEALLVFRTVSQPSELLGTIDDILQGTIVSHTVMTQNEPQVLDVVDIPEISPQPVAFNTDLPYLHFESPPKRILFGPGSIKVAHGPDEFIDITELKAGVNWLESIVLAMSK